MGHNFLYHPGKAIKYLFFGKTDSQDKQNRDIVSPEERAYRKKRRIVSILSFIVLIAFFLVITFTLGKPLLEFSSHPEQFRQWIDQQGFWGRFLLVGMIILQVVVAVIPGEVIEIGAGYAFGAWEGTFLVLLGAAIGSAFIFLLTKKLGIKMVEAFVPREKINELRFINTEKKRNLFVFISFFIPGTPKDLLTYFMGLTSMKLPSFLLISSFARIPSVITSTIGGHALGLQDYTFAVIVFVITIVISGIGLLLYNYLVRRKNKQAKEIVPSEKNKN